MSLSEEVNNIIGQKESEILEYKAVLPPSKSIAQLIAGFANAGGGFIILGVSESPSGKIEVNGLSEDFHANTITHKALDFLSPQPKIDYQYITHNGKNIYVIKIEKSQTKILIENKEFKRIGDKTKLLNPVEINFRANGYGRIKDINEQLESYKKVSTSAKFRVFEHYQSILKIIDDLGLLLYPENINIPTDNQEGKILSRILYSSFVDNFETYLSDLLYEIFLAHPSTLKSDQTVTIKEVLNCSDLQEFVKYWAKQKLGKLQKGSVKGFIEDNKQIKELGILGKEQKDIERILQIRHLYSHRNGIVDEKFLQYFTDKYVLNSEHRMAISEICDKLVYLADIIEQIDNVSSKKFKLSVSVMG